MRLARPLVLLALALPAALPAAASAAKPETPAQARKALSEAQQTLDGNGVRTGREATPALTRLAAGKNLLSSSDRRVANSLLARPTNQSADPQQNGYTTFEQAPYCTPNFCVHYVATTADAPPQTPAVDGIPVYVKNMADQFEYVHSIENGVDQMGWQPPKSDGTLGGSAKTDVYIKQIGDQGIYGYAAPEQNARSSYAYLVMDNDYSPSEFPSSATPADALEVTAAHEYNHVLQFNYDSYQDTWMLESTATWSEEQVYPAVNDYLGYLGTWASPSCTTVPLTSFDGAGTTCQQLKAYGSAVWNHWLTARSSRDVIRTAWENSQAAGDFAPAAYSSAIAAQPGGVDFTDEFDRFSAAVAEWRAPGSAFPDRASYPDVSRSGSPLAIDGTPRPSEVLDHTTFRLIGVTADPSKPRARLHAELPSGLKGALALVGRTGSNDTQGTVTTVLQQLPSGGAGDVTLPNPGSYGRITAVLVNADPSQAGYSNTTGDWIWTRDGQPFANVGVFSDGAPSTTTPATTTPAPTTSTSPTAVPAPAASTQLATPLPPPALTTRLALKSPQRLSTVLAKGVSFRLRCNRACRVKGRLRFSGAGIAGLKRNQTVGTVSTRLSKAGVKTIRIKLTRKARAALSRRLRVKVNLTLVVAPSSGKSQTIKRTLTLRR